MKTELTFDSEFEQLYKSWCNDETMRKMLKLSGVAIDQVDIGAMSHKYFKDSWQEDGTIDHNANSNNIGPINYGLEIAKPTMKLLGLYLLHRYLRKDHSLETANMLLNDVITGEYYVHDSSGIGIQIPYCYAWTTMWVAENGIPYGQLPSQPPKHARSFVGQVAEVTMDLSQEFAGAVAPADMLIVYSYFAKKEKLTDKEIENDLQSFVHIMNKQFRPGGQCVDEDTEVLTPEGFKNYQTLKVGDSIYTWNDGKLNIQKVKAVNVYDHDGEMHVYSGRDTIQMVTPNHRVLHKLNNKNEYALTESSGLIGQKTPLTYPVAMLTDDREDCNISDEMLKLCVMILCDGSLRESCDGIRFYKSPNRWGGDEFIDTCNALDISVSTKWREGAGSFSGVNEYYINAVDACDIRMQLDNTRDNIPDWMFHLSRRQAQLVIDTWSKLDGYSDSGKTKLQCDNYQIANALQHICFLAGMGSRVTERVIGNNKTPTIYVTPYTRVHKSAACKDVVHYTGKVWCPSTDDGIVVFRKDGMLFISGNSPFTNLSILDHDNIESLFGDAIFPDGSKLDINYAMHVQDVFLRWFSQGNPTNGEPYRFPVTTMNFTKNEYGKVIDLDFLFKMAVFNTKLGAFNIHSGERAKLAMCPLHGDEQVLIRNHKGIFDSRIGDLGNHDKTDYEVMINGRFESGKFIKTYTDSFIEVTLSNGHKFKTTPEHLNVTKRGTLMSKDLVVGDLIPFSLIPYTGEGGDYHMGLMVGAYLGDGSVGGRTVTFSLNHTTKAELFDILEFYINNTLGGKTRTVERDNVKLLETNSNVVHGILSQFAYGNDKALKKGMLPEVYEKSLEFRKGVYDGYYATDGGNKDRIYTSSKRMVHDLSVLAATMGTVTNIKTVDERDGRYSDKPNYCVKTYSRDGLLNRSYAGVWESDVDKAWFYITDIQTINKAGPAYCFEMNADEHLFQLSNGMITHNCRFVNDPETMSHFKTDTFGNGGLNIGSHRIVAMNMPRYAYMANDIDEFLDILEERMERAAIILVTHRERILKKRIEQGFLRAFQVGIASLDSMFSTIGVNGMPECIEALGEPLVSPDGFNMRPAAKELQIKILEFMDNKRLELSKRYGVPFNIEEVPGESAAINMRDKDAILFEDNVHPNRLYSNQFIPVTYPVAKKDRIEATGEFMKYMTGGSILHLNVDEAIKDPMVMYELMKYMIEAGVDHFAINYGFSRCPHGHSNSGIHDLCPECMAPIMDYLTRVVGYFVPVSSWNKVRREQDFGQRQLY